MHVWRLSRRAHAAGAYNGRGAALYGARWNSRNVAVAYASESRSLAMLEYLAHVERASAPGDLVFVEAVIPDADVVALDSARLPRNWRSEPPSPELRAVGDDWVASKRGLALRVPSVIVPQEFNLLINPAHGRFRSIRVLSPQAVTIDPRLL